MTACIVLGFVGLGFLLTYIVSKRAYSPIEQLVNYGRDLSKGRIGGEMSDLAVIKSCMDYLQSETEKLVRHMEKIEPSLREQFLQRLAAKEFLDNRTIYEQCRTFGIPVDRVYVVLVVKLENFYKEKRFMPEERPIVTFAIKNVIQELLDQNHELNGYVFQTKEGEGAVLLEFNRNSSEETMLGAVRQYASSICEALRKYMSLTVSVGIGRFYEHIADVPVSCGEAELALRHRVYRENEGVIHIDDLEHSNKQSMFFYPRHLASSIVSSLAKGDIQQAEQSLTEFTNVLRASKSYLLIYQSYCVLLSEIISSMENEGTNMFDIMEHDLFGQLQERQTWREIFDWFVEELFPLYDKLVDESRTSTGKSVIMQVCKHIRDNVYSDLSLIQCAELVGISPSYLSRLFKKETGVSFLDFVKETKVEEAKRLLVETDDNVKDIAERIGYSERNLNRMFNQYLNMSPSQYRMLHR